MDREELMSELSKKNIQSRPIWYLNHLQIPYCNNRAYKIEKAFWFWERTLNIPSGGSLSLIEIKKVTTEIKNLARKKWKTKRYPFVTRRIDKTALKKMDEASRKIVFIVSSQNVLLGVVTDGDVRRWILKGKTLKCGHR